MTTESDENYKPDTSQAWQPAIEGMDGGDNSDDTTHVDEWQSLVAPDRETVESGNETTGDGADQSTWTALLGSFKPDDSDTDTDGRTGVLSTYIEWHALVIGLAVGAFAASSGAGIETIAAIVGLGAGGARLQLGIPDKYLQQAASELPYFVFGAGVSYLAVSLLGPSTL